jgi:hypothetical protein
VDDELEAPRKKELEKSLAHDGNLQLQHQLLLKTKLDPSEKIPCPNKEALYHRSGRVVIFRPWMRMAAAAVIIAATAGIFYYTGSGSGMPSASGSTADAGTKTSVPKKAETNTGTIPVKENKAASPELVAANNNEVKNKKANANVNRVPQRDNITNQVAYKGIQQNGDPVDISNENLPQRTPRVIEGIALVDTHKETLNNPGVTSSLPDRITTIPAADAASIDNKGSVKGFLRKATRLIEKRTGIDPTNEDGELLIGVIAVKLK